MTTNKGSRYWSGCIQQGLELLTRLLCGSGDIFIVKTSELHHSISADKIRNREPHVTLYKSISPKQPGDCC